VLAATSLFVFSIFFAPKRGLLAKVLIRMSVKKEVLKQPYMKKIKEGETL
jgi:manganese/zinc/iron transport system permease protein